MKVTIQFQFALSDTVIVPCFFQQYHIVPKMLHEIKSSHKIPAQLLWPTFLRRKTRCASRSDAGSEINRLFYMQSIAHVEREDFNESRVALLVATAVLGTLVTPLLSI